jgi:flagellin
MIGAMSSSLALAQRTASQARATMDTMARQLATGQKVSSVKDDGAAWARANTARGNATASRQVAGDLRFIASGVAAGRDSLEGQLPMIQIMRDRALQASDATISAETRTMLADMQLADNSARQTALSHNSVNGSFALQRANGTGLWLAHSAVAGSGDLSWVSDINGGTVLSSLTSPTLMPTLGTLDTLANAQNAAIQTGIAVQRISSRSNEIQAIENRMTGQATLLEAQADRLDALAGSLTDADLSKASTALRQSETRQQLALQTVRTAISAYGNFAGGLLGNVQRTQRGLLA